MKRSPAFSSFSSVRLDDHKLHGIDTTSWAPIILFLMAVFGLFNASMFKNRLGNGLLRWWYFLPGCHDPALNIHTWLGGIINSILGPLAANPYILIPMICIAVYLVRTVVISQTATTALFYAALIGVCQSVGIHPFVLLFVTYMSTLVWHFSFTNVTYVAALGATGGDMATIMTISP